MSWLSTLTHSQLLWVTVVLLAIWIASGLICLLGNISKDRPTSVHDETESEKTLKPTTEPAEVNLLGQLIENKVDSTAVDEVKLSEAKLGTNQEAELTLVSKSSSCPQCQNKKCQPLLLAEKANQSETMKRKEENSKLTEEAVLSFDLSSTAEDKNTKRQKFEMSTDLNIIQPVETSKDLQVPAIQKEENNGKTSKDDVAKPADIPPVEVKIGTIEETDVDVCQMDIVAPAEMKEKEESKMLVERNKRPTQVLVIPLELETPTVTLSTSRIRLNPDDPRLYERAEKKPVFPSRELRKTLSPPKEENLCGHIRRRNQPREEQHYFRY